MRHNRNIPGPEKKFILVADSMADFSKIPKCINKFDGRMPMVMFGPLILRLTRGLQLHDRLRSQGAETILDDKLAHNSDQIADLMSQTRKLGFGYETIAPNVGVNGLVAAGREQAATELGKSIGVIAALAEYNRKRSKIDLAEIKEANELLDPEHKIKRIMCNVSDIEKAKAIGDITVIATGIRMPGQSADDHSVVATPGEAIRRGADLVAVGRPIMHADDIAYAFDQMLDNVASVS